MIIGTPMLFISSKHTIFYRDIEILGWAVLPNFVLFSLARQISLLVIIPETKFIEGWIATTVLGITEKKTTKRKAYSKTDCRELVNESSF